MLLNVLNKNRRVSNKSGKDKKKARKSERITSTRIHPHTPPTSTHIRPHPTTYTTHIRSLYTDKNRPRTVPGRVLGCAGFARVGGAAEPCFTASGTRHRRRPRTARRVQAWAIKSMSPATLHAMAAIKIESVNLPLGIVLLEESINLARRC